MPGSPLGDKTVQEASFCTCQICPWKFRRSTRLNSRLVAFAIVSGQNPCPKSINTERKQSFQCQYRYGHYPDDGTYSVDSENRVEASIPANLVFYFTLFYRSIQEFLSLLLTKNFSLSRLYIIDYKIRVPFHELASTYLLYYQL